jgi:hypothetical protein
MGCIGSSESNEVADNPLKVDNNKSSTLPSKVVMITKISRPANVFFIRSYSTDDNVKIKHINLVKDLLAPFGCAFNEDKRSLKSGANRTFIGTIKKWFSSEREVDFYCAAFTAGSASGAEARDADAYICICDLSGDVSEWTLCFQFLEMRALYESRSETPKLIIGYKSLPERNIPEDQLPEKYPFVDASRDLPRNAEEKIPLNIDVLKPAFTEAVSGAVSHLR